MRSKRSIAPAALAALMLLLIAGVAALWQLRLDAGDSFPEYSSMRSDPLGTRALVESLESLPGLTVERNFADLARLPEGAGATLLCLGLKMNYGGLQGALLEWGDNTALDRFVLEGGRLVVMLRPIAEPREYRWSQADDEEATSVTLEKLGLGPSNPDGKSGQKKDQPSGKKSDEATGNKSGNKPVNKPGRDPKRQDGPTTSPFTFKLHPDIVREVSPAFADVHTTFTQLMLAGDGADRHWTPASVANVSEMPGFPETLKWRSGVTFVTAKSDWTPILKRGDRPVLMERHYGKGSIVVASDAYAVSNEGLRDERQPALLAWLIGSSRRILIDETHLGIAEEPGVATLARRYHLQFVILALIVLAILYIWKNAFSLTPPADEARLVAQQQMAQAGRDAWSGLTDLIERNVGPAKILSVCLEEWRRSAQSKQSTWTQLDRELDAIVQSEAALPANKRNPPETYRRMAEALRRSRRSGGRS